MPLAPSIKHNRNRTLAIDPGHAVAVCRA